MGLRRLILVSLSGFRNRIEETRVKLGRNVDFCGKITCQKAGLLSFLPPAGCLRGGAGLTFW